MPTTTTGVDPAAKRHISGQRWWPAPKLQGDPGMKGVLATCVSRSADLYQVNQRKPHRGVNFIIAHDGFTLCDLVSYNLKGHCGACWAFGVVECLQDRFCIPNGMDISLSVNKHLSPC
ncbi:hypothetical protein VPH35_002952 [Triticum aestivum]